MENATAIKFEEKENTMPSPFQEIQRDTGKADQTVTEYPESGTSSLLDTLSQKWWYNAIPSGTPYSEYLKEFYSGSAAGINSAMDYEKVMESFSQIANATNLIYNGSKEVRGSILLDPMKSGCYDFSDKRKMPSVKFCKPVINGDPEHFEEVSRLIREVSANELPILEAEVRKWETQIDSYANGNTIAKIFTYELETPNFTGKTPPVDWWENPTYSGGVNPISTASADYMSDTHKNAINNVVSSVVNRLESKISSGIPQKRNVDMAYDAAKQALRAGATDINENMPPVEPFEESPTETEIPEEAEPTPMPMPEFVCEIKPPEFWLWEMDEMIKNLRTVLLQNLIREFIIKPIKQAGAQIKAAADKIKSAGDAVKDVAADLTKIQKALKSLGGDLINAATGIFNAADIFKAMGIDLTALFNIQWLLPPLIDPCISLGRCQHRRKS